LTPDSAPIEAVMAQVHALIAARGSWVSFTGLDGETDPVPARENP